MSSGAPPIARSSRGASLQVSTDGGTTWTAVAQLRTITPSGKKTEIIDQTNLLTPGTAKIKLAVQVDTGSVGYEGILNPTDAGLNLLSSLQDGLTLANFRILLPAPPLVYITQSAPGANVAGLVWVYTEFWSYLAGDIILDPSNHLQVAQLAFTAEGVSSWNDSGGFTTDGTTTNAWKDMGLVAGSYPVQLFVAGTLADMVPGMLLTVSGCSVPAFDTGGPFPRPTYPAPVFDYGPYPGSAATKLGYMQPLASSEATFDDTVTLVTLYRLGQPTIHSFTGYVVEHVPFKLGIGRVCTFAGKIEISGPITTVLGDVWPGASAGVPGLTIMSGGGGGGGVSGWLAPLWTTYNASATVPLTAQAIKAEGGTEGIALELTAGGTYYIVKYDNTAGPITLTYESVTIYELTGYLQFVLLSWDGSEFLEMAGN